MSVAGVFALSGCETATSPTDAGAAPGDANVLTDGGDVDAGTGTDAGAATDAGTGTDAGATDAGAGTDAGTGTDAGATDAGFDAATLVETDPPAATIAFPPPLSLTESDTLTVRGTASDASTISELRVAGVLATSADGFATWTASVPLSLGRSTLEVSASDEHGNSGASLASVEVDRVDPMLVGPGALAYAAPDRAFVYDSTLRAIYEVDLSTGQRTEVESGVPSPYGLTYDAAGGRLLYATRTTVRSVDPATGATATVSSNAIASPIDFEFINGAAFTSSTGYVADSNQDVVLAVDLATGVRSELSGSVGTGPAIDGAGHLGLDVARDRLLLFHRPALANELLAVDLTSGDRTVYGAPDYTLWEPFGVDSVGRVIYQTAAIWLRRFDGVTDEPVFTMGRPSLVRFPSSVALRADDRVLLAYNRFDSITEVDLTAGTASFLSRSELRAGEPIYIPGAIALDGLDLYLTDDADVGTRSQLDRIGLADRTRAEVSGNLVGTGPFFTSVSDLELSASGDTAWVMEGSFGQLTQVDVATGDRFEVVNDTALGRPYQLSVDEAAGLAYLVDGNSPGRIIELTMATGAWSVIGSDSVGTGHALDGCRDVAVDGARLLLACRDGITTLDLGTGARAQLSALPTTGSTTRLIVTGSDGSVFISNGFTVFSADSAGALTEVAGSSSPLQIGQHRGLSYDAANERLIVLSVDRNSVFAVDLPTGETVIVYR